MGILKNIIKENMGVKEKPIRCVTINGHCKNSLWKQGLMPLIKSSLINIGMETQELPVTGLSVAVMSPKESFNDSLSTVLNTVADGQPNNVLIGILDEDGGSVFDDKQKAILKPLKKLIADTNGTFIYNSIDELADAINDRLDSDYRLMEVKNSNSTADTIDSAFR